MWILLAIVLVVLGMMFGWRLARLLGTGLAIGGAATELKGNQRQRKREGERLAKERIDIEESARETDGMIQKYRRGRGGRR